jgi:hypothetical protein
MRRPSGAAHADRLHAKILHHALMPSDKRRWCPHHRAPPRDTHQSNGTSNDIIANAAAQRAVAAAGRRCDDLDRRADLLAALRLRDAAMRMRALAGAIREAVTQ